MSRYYFIENQFHTFLGGIIMKNHYSIGILFADLAKSGLTHDYFAGILDSFKRAIEANAVVMLERTNL